MNRDYFEILSPYDENSILTLEYVNCDLTKSVADRNFVYPDYYSCRRVKYGEVQTIWDYYSLFFEVATLKFKDSDAHLFQKQFLLSDGNLYYFDMAEELSYLPGVQYLQTYQMADYDSELNEIRDVSSEYSEHDERRLELSFTASRRDPLFPPTEKYTVILQHSDQSGWRVDDCSSQYAVGYLVSEILEGGENHASPKTDLPKQIECCLKESGLM